MASRRVRSLLLLNGVLLLMLAVVSIPAAARQSRDRSRGNYVAVAGRVIGVSESVMYIVDSTNQEMVAVRWDRSRKRLMGVGFRDLVTDQSARPAEEIGR